VAPINVVICVTAYVRGEEANFSWLFFFFATPRRKTEAGDLKTATPPCEAGVSKRKATGECC